MATEVKTTPVQEQLRQLNDARKLVLSNTVYYQPIIDSVLPILGPNSQPELRRWGADFVAEAFASPILPRDEKEKLLPKVLVALQMVMENPNEDAYVVRGIIQAAASIYPLAMRWKYVHFYKTAFDCFPSLLVLIAVCLLRRDAPHATAVTPNYIANGPVRLTLRCFTGSTTPKIRQHGTP